MDYRQTRTVCSAGLRRYIHFGAHCTACLWIYGQKTDMPFVRVKGEPNYEFRLARMLFSHQSSL